MPSNVKFTATDGEIIRTTLYGEKNVGSGTFVILVHGFKGFKDWGFWPHIGKHFANQGLAALTFNFSHNGVGKSLTEFDELEKFAENTFSREVRELSELIEATRMGYFGQMGIQRIALVGHSRGGGIALVTARQNPPVSSVVLWSSICRFDRYTERQVTEWRNAGYYDVLNQRTKQKMRLNVDLLEDLEKNQDDLLNLEKAARELNRPLLIIHGEQDLSVPMAEAQQLFEWTGRMKSELFIVPQTGHTFGAVHPFEGTTDALETVLDKTAGWLG